MCRQYNDAQRSNMFTTNAFAKTLRGVTKSIKMLGIAALQMLAFNLIIAAVEGLVKALDNLHMSAKEAAEVTQKAVSDFENQCSAIDGNIKTVESLKDRYYELSRGVNDLGENVALSADEYAEYKDIVQQIIDLTPSVIQGYNDEGEAILDRNGLIQQSIDLLRQERIEKAKNAAYSSTDNDGRKTNLEAAVIDFDKNYEKRTIEATQIARSFSMQIRDAFSKVSSEDAAAFQALIEKYAGASVSDIKPLVSYAESGSALEQTATLYDLID